MGTFDFDSYKKLNIYDFYKEKEDEHTKTCPECIGFVSVNVKDTCKMCKGRGYILKDN